MEFTKHFCCGPCRSAPLSITGSIPKTGYVPGETIPVTASVVNKSSKSINCVKFTLCTIVKYHSTTPTHKTKSEVIEICEKLASGVPPESDGKFHVALVVPPVGPTDNDLSQIITIEYVVKIEGQTTGPHVSPVLMTPITIGTVPLTQKETPRLTLAPLLMPPSRDTRPSAPSILTPTSGPEYEQCTSMGVGGAGAYPWMLLETGILIYIKQHII